MLPAVRRAFADATLTTWEWLQSRAAVTPGTRRAARFAEFGEGTFICFPPQALYGEHAIVLGANTAIGPNVALSVGMVPGQELIGERMLRIGDRCLIGRGSSIACHFDIEIGDDVFFGPNVYVTDQNHGNVDPSVPIGRQTAPEQAVRIGSGSWLATGVVVTPGVTIGHNVTVGANSVVTTDLPDGAVAVGAPARVVNERPDSGA
ncbi:MAG: acyltransferase [Actinomycetota bacterium]